MIEADVQRAKDIAIRAACDAFLKKLEELAPDLALADIVGTRHIHLALLMGMAEPVLVSFEVNYTTDKDLIATAIASKAAGVD